MRLTLFLILGFWLSSSASSYSQNTRMGIKLKNGTIAELMKYVEDNSEFVFLYKNEDLDIKKLVSVELENASLDQILAAGFEGQNVGWDVYDRQIVIHKKEKLRFAENAALQQRTITGVVTDQRGLPLPGVTVVVKGTTTGTVTSPDGNFTLTIPQNAETLQFSFIGMRSQEIAIEGRTTFTIMMEEETIGVDEVVVVGYGTQKRSDITGTVASLGKERLEMVPNLNIAQAIQGAIPGVMIQTSAAGAAPDQVLMVRGRNSILASNDPLIVLDGIPYYGLISDINPNDVKSIEVLKDASSAAIYGSRGANGVILITSKDGVVGKAKVNYDGKYSIQNAANLPDLMNGEEFYQFKLKREPNNITATEKHVYESGQWVDWIDFATRIGHSQLHNVSVSGGTEIVNYYIAGGLNDVKGIRVNDDYKRYTGQFNLEIKVSSLISLGTRTGLSFDDKSGQAPTSGVWRMNPLSIPFDENGNWNIYPWPEDIYFENPMETILFDDLDKSSQISTNNYIIIGLPFVPEFNYRMNFGVRQRNRKASSYAGMDTGTGFEVRGLANINNSTDKNLTLENIFSYTKTFNLHTIFATALYSFEKNNYESDRLNARGFPHDFLSWHAVGQAEVVIPSSSFNETVLLSQMLRLNYSYDSRYLFTLTGRRDGFSGFGSGTKWGVFPSVALGWNISNEDFFPWKNLFSELKLRSSFGLNGNQAVGAYQTIAKLGSYNIINQNVSVPGYVPISLGQDNLGWESSKTLNVGLDFGLLSSRITGDINVYNTITSDLLLNRTISAVHGITSITQNIGKTQNQGIEVSLVSRNLTSGDFRWITSGNASFMKNKIVSLYGYLDENGNEIDDIANKWFIGKPIKVNYNYVMTGVWQLNEAEEAEIYKSKPGYVKFKDVNNDKLISATYDREIIGQQDPKFLWGMNNTFSYKNFGLNIFLHGVHGVTRANVLMIDDVYETVRRNTIKKNWWTPENPTNDFYMNDKFANTLGGDESQDFYYENASFVRVKDISLSYDFSDRFLQKSKLDKLKLYITGSNLFTFTKWRGMDPELDEQRESIYHKEIVFGLTLGF